MDEIEPKPSKPSADRVAEPSTKYGGFQLTDEYLSWIAEVEALPENQSGADKTWVAELLHTSAQHYARAKRIR
ncbi:MAG: hypothetical protein IPJ77_01680 [Planctomycetes bacterium]|nr:hypothetical protein [Planctomycetota bacterium]